MPEKIARVQATIYVTTHLSIAPKIQQEKSDTLGHKETKNQELTMNFELS